MVLGILEVHLEVLNNEVIGIWNPKEKSGTVL